MSETVDNLLLDLLESVRERRYLETMEAWRTSSPRLPVWKARRIWAPRVVRERPRLSPAYVELTMAPDHEAGQDGPAGVLVMRHRV